MNNCKYISEDGTCRRVSDAEVKEPCVEGPCNHYVFHIEKALRGLGSMDFSEYSMGQVGLVSADMMREIQRLCLDAADRIRELEEA